MELLDSRRLTGVNILWDRPGAVLDVALSEAERDGLIEAWTDALRERLDALGWAAEASRVRTFPGGASLACSAPLDALYAATEINGSAWRTATARVRGEVPEDLDEELVRLRVEIATESKPGLLALRRAARERGLQFLSVDARARDHLVQPGPREPRPEPAPGARRSREPPRRQRALAVPWRRADPPA